MTIPHHYSMKWDNYHSHVGDIFSQLLETGSMADVVLYAEGEKINCHKMLLSACSPYFQEILSTAGASNTIVVVSGICGEDVRSIIEFVYRGEISVKADRFSSVLKAAEALKICGLMEVSSHLSEMEDSDVITGNIVEKNTEPQKEELNHTLNHSNLVIKDNRRNKKIPLQPSLESSWNCIEMPVQNYNIIKQNNPSSNIVHNNNVKGSSIKDYSVSDSKLNSDSSKDLLERDINIDCNSEETFKLKTEPNNTCDVSTKMECTANSEEESLCEEVQLKLKKRKDIRKKLYSEDAMLAALEDMKSGRNLVEAAAKHRVPRTTLYMRARAIGACPAMVRKGYPREKITAALESVAGGSSLQCAANEFGIPKTVLWRRVQKEIGNTPPQNKRVKSAVVASQVTSKEAVVQEGVSITRVSPQYQIPKATLFRWEKVPLANEIKLPKMFVKDGPNKEDITEEVVIDSEITNNSNLNKPDISSECTTDKNFKIHKSAWHNIQSSSSSGPPIQNAMLLKSESEDTVAVEQLKQQQEESGFNFSEGVHELPVSYVNNAQFSNSSIIILAPVESDKYSTQEHENEVVCGSIDPEKVLQSIKVENNDNNPDGSKITGI